MKRSDDIWAAARHRWEADPALTLTALADELGVSRPTVSFRAKRENWHKQGVAMSPVDALAQVVADTLNEPQNFLVVDNISTVLDLSVSSRVRVIQRHRAEWAQWEELFPLDVMAGSPTAARRAKLAAEAIAIKQRGQSIAFGLITYGGQNTDAPLVEPLDEADRPPSRADRIFEAARLNGGRIPESFFGDGNGDTAQDATVKLPPHPMPLEED